MFITVTVATCKQWYFSYNWTTSTARQVTQHNRRRSSSNNNNNSNNNDTPTATTASNSQVLWVMNAEIRLQWLEWSSWEFALPAASKQRAVQVYSFYSFIILSQASYSRKLCNCKNVIKYNNTNTLYIYKYYFTTKLYLLNYILLDDRYNTTRHGNIYSN